jgi:vesicle-fusing ATPase
MWRAPREGLHTTNMEIAYSKTQPEIANLVGKIQPYAQNIADCSLRNRCRLLKPALGFDAAAIALTFLPAAGESLQSGRTKEDDAFTFHHLRREVYKEVVAAGVEVDSRYIVNSSHITVARFISERDFVQEGKTELDTDKVKLLINTMNEINQWLEAKYWPKEDGSPIKDGGEWLVGQEMGLDLRSGTAWYGVGDRVVIGKGY